MHCLTRALRCNSSLATSRFLYERLFQYKITHLRFFTSSNYYQKQIETSGHTFSTIYRFPYITVGSVINRCKRYQFYMTGISIPGSFLLHTFNFVGVGVPIAVTSVGIASTVAVLAMARVFSGMVGYIYVNSDRSIVKIAYLSSSGTRRELVVNRNDIEGLSQRSPTLFYRTVYIKSSEEPLIKVNLSMAQIIDRQSFESIFDFDLGVD